MEPPRDNLSWFIGVFGASLLNGVAVITITGFLWKIFHAHELRHKSHEDLHDSEKDHNHAMEEAIKTMQSDIVDLQNK